VDLAELTGLSSGRVADGAGRAFLAGDYLRAAFAAGRGCRSRSTHPGGKSLAPWELWPRCLAEMVPFAAFAANAGTGALRAWELVKPSS